MNTPVASSKPPAVALLILDAAGTVRAANEAAGLLWQSPPANLAGQPIVTLFAFEVTSEAPDWHQSQWEVLLATALGRPLRLHAQPFEPVPALAVTIELQNAHGPDSVYFARIEPLPAAPAIPATTSAAPTVSNDISDSPIVPNCPPADGPRLLAESGPLGFFDLDLQTGRLIASPAWKRMLGYAPEELPDTHQAWRELIHPDDTAALPDRVVKPPLGNHREFTIECRLRHRLGHYVWVHSAGIQVFGSDRSLLRVIGLNVDIHERKEIEEIGLISEDRISRLTDTAGLAVFELDFANDLHWFAPACATLLGEGLATPSLETLKQALPAPVAELGLDGFFASFAPDESYAHQSIKLRMNDGREIPVVLGVHRQWTRKRVLTRVIGFLLPLPAGTGESEALPSVLVEAMLDSFSEAVIVTDAHAQIVHLNAKATRLTGWTLAAARACKLNDVFKLVHADTGLPDDAAVDLVLATDKPPRLHAEHALVAATGGNPVPIIWSPRRVESPTGSTEGVVLVFRNPDEMTLSPEERLRANRFESLGQLAGGISHDFNNLLTTILGGISTAKDNRDYTKLEDAENACMAAKALTRQLLTFAKGGAATAQQVIAPGEMLQDAVRIAAAGTTAVVSVDAPENLAPIQVDRGQIIQVFQNLIINALQAMPELGKGRVQLRGRDVRLTANAVPPLPAGDYVQIEVQDNGTGIPPDHLEKIFEPFYTTKKQGTGLGLATVRSIVRQHGGQITVASAVGAGTTFTVCLPRADRPVPAPVRSTPALRFGTGRILFLDDDPKIGELTGGMLASLDYTYDVVRTGEDAIIFYRRYFNVGRPYDAVILDLNVVGGMGGEECFKHLVALHPEVRAIVNSGYDSEEMARRYHAMGFVGYLTKPYRVGDLARIIKVALGKA